VGSTLSATSDPAGRLVIAADSDPARDRRQSRSRTSLLGTATEVDHVGPLTTTGTRCSARPALPVTGYVAPRRRHCQRFRTPISAASRTRPPSPIPVRDSTVKIRYSVGSRPAASRRSMRSPVDDDRQASRGRGRS